LSSVASIINNNNNYDYGMPHNNDNGAASRDHMSSRFYVGAICAKISSNLYRHSCVPILLDRLTLVQTKVVNIAIPVPLSPATTILAIIFVLLAIFDNNTFAELNQHRSGPLATTRMACDMYTKFSGSGTL